MLCLYLLLFSVHYKVFLQDRLNTSFLQDRSFLQDLGMREQKQQETEKEVNSIKYEIRISLSTFLQQKSMYRKDRLYKHMDYENLKVEK